MDYSLPIADFFVLRIKDYDEIIRLDSMDATAYNDRGVAWAEQGNIVEAIADYDEAIHLNPTYAVAYNNRGNARSVQGDLVGALADYDEAIRLNPTYADAHNNRGNARSAQGDRVDALADYNEAIRLNPVYATAYNNRANEHKAQGNLMGAVADYNKALELSDRLPDKGKLIYRSLGDVYGQLEHWTEAKTAYQQALAFAPDNLLDWLSLATAARHCADEATLQTAFEQAQRLLKEGDLYNRACLESVAGNTEQALDLLAQAVAADPALKAQAQDDVGLFWVRTEPHFAEIVG
ncbi:MAG: tetratricopeptide repeat protein [Caldilineaceae bacterium]